MKIEWIYLIILVLAVTAISGCTTSSPAVTPTATPATATATPAPTAATAVPSAAGTATPTSAPTTAAPSTASVSISGFAFQPATVTIAKGGTVTWTNNDGTAHTVKFPDSESPALSSGKTYSKTFDTTGTFSYICGIHTYMHGTVTVV